MNDKTREEFTELATDELARVTGVIGDEVGKSLLEFGEFEAAHDGFRGRDVVLGFLLSVTVVHAYRVLKVASPSRELDEVTKRYVIDTLDDALSAMMRNEIDVWGKMQ